MHNLVLPVGVWRTTTTSATAAVMGIEVAFVDAQGKAEYVARILHDAAQRDLGDRHVATT